jgi:hypothetical protein
MESEPTRRVVTTSTKSVGIAILVTVLLGPARHALRDDPGRLDHVHPETARFAPHGWDRPHRLVAHRHLVVGCVGLGLQQEAHGGLTRRGCRERHSPLRSPSSCLSNEPTRAAQPGFALAAAVVELCPPCFAGDDRGVPRGTQRHGVGGGPDRRGSSAIPASANETAVGSVTRRSRPTG